ncbi:hypothetical protein [Aeoliella sp.]|uniref:hypothetical protein n=1 Tax=Aeoliella sp. TaxID=2795800 RepID=UPI003CCC4319
MQNLLRILESFDGKHAEPLVELADGTPASEANIQKLLALAEHDQALVRAGATWVLKRWHDRGVNFSANAVATMVRLLGQETEWGSQLHLVQMLTILEIPKASARKLKAEAAKLAHSENKFVRAWATSALANLADQHPAYRHAALKVFAEVEQDAAASVKARVRKVLKQFHWARRESE